MLYDTHAHFFSDDIVTYPIDTTGAREGEDVLRRRIMDRPSTPDVVLASWAVNGVAGGAGVQYNSAYKTDNRYLLDVSDAAPDRISAVVILDPQDSATPQVLADMASEHGIRGVRMTGFPDEAGRYPYFESEAALATWSAAERLGIAVVLMYLPGRKPSAVALGRIGELADRFPRLAIVLDHCGWPAAQGAPDYGMGDAHRALAARANIYFKLTTINLNQLENAGVPAPAFVKRLVELYGADRIMWGSDFGNTEGTFESMVERAKAATAELTEAQRRAVLHDTGARLFARRGPAEGR
ncbi:amidohydrolase family protein [Novosphingobium aquimarinum]|uniref:amidohydrolase family protein n=1 Tax=Novosphingobium aquimarinum TaxID=2682494 RepID=UPI0012EB4B2F|nr:amidohydrolase family protein [Novosphingobium aquimarinum]